MKLARIEHKGRLTIGKVVGEEIVVLDGSLFDIQGETNIRYSLADVKLLPPVIPTKIACIGMNYRGHIEEVGESIPETPRFFLKPPSCLIAHEEAIIIPKGAERVDYEGELALVIKKKAKEVAEEEALNYVLGYSCFNDVTERAIVMRNTGDLTLSKCFDTFGPFGPYIVTGLDSTSLAIKTYLNGRLVQNDNTKNFVFSIQHIIHYLSQAITFYPGDIIITGTPRGIGPLNAGDEVEVEIEGIGRLRNPVRSYGGK
jgi:2-keto-4-pentenoate hydratase/2-oxohepta-3-ene-1,7-dioic acid hydratase in catechol pathway